MSEISTEDLISSYINLREAIKDKEEEHKKELEDMKSSMDSVSAKLLELCNEHNVDSLKTSAGTVSRRINSRYWASDWDEVYKFIEEHEAPYLLEKRIHNGNMKEFLEDNPELVPTGLQTDRKYVIQVRKPTTK